MPTAGILSALASFRDSRLRILNAENGLLIMMESLDRVLAHYDHEDRCHLGLDNDTPNERPVTPRPSPAAKVVALPRVGGLHYRYEWREAA